MKRHFSKPECSSFTLVELLVVIGIIAILAAVVIGSFSNVMNSVKRAKAGVLANQTQTSCMNYYSEYSLYPIPTSYTAGGDPFFNAADTTDWQQLTYALCGNINPYTAVAVTTTGINSRNIPYLTPNRSDVTTTTGIIKNPLPPKNTTTDFYFNIIMDGDYSGICGDGTSANYANIPDFVTSTTSTVSKMTSGGLTQGVAVWANCNQGTTNINFYVKTF